MLSTGPHIQMAIVGSVNFTSSLNPSDASGASDAGSGVSAAELPLKFSSASLERVANDSSSSSRVSEPSAFVPSAGSRERESSSPSSAEDSGATTAIARARRRRRAGPVAATTESAPGAAPRRAGAGVDEACRTHRRQTQCARRPRRGAGDGACSRGGASVATTLVATDIVASLFVAPVRAARSVRGCRGCGSTLARSWLATCT